MKEPPSAEHMGNSSDYNLIWQVSREVTRPVEVMYYISLEKEEEAVWSAASNTSKLIFSIISQGAMCGTLKRFGVVKWT